MSRRGKRRNSKRRKSSSSSKQSVSQYIFQKQNKSNSYKDELVEKGETDSFRKENALSGSEDEEKYNGTPPKEKRFKQDYHVNVFPNHRNIYTSTTKDTEKGVQVVTSVSVDDVDDAAPTFMFQQLQEPLYSSPTTPSMPVANIMKINCSGSQVKLEIQEILQLNSSGLKTTFVLCNEKGDGPAAVFKSRCERTWIPNNDQPFQQVSAQNYRFTFSTEQMEAQSDSHSVSPTTSWDKDPSPVFTASGHPPDPRFNLTPHAKRNYFHKSFSTDPCWDVPPPQEFADFKYNTLEDLSHDLASCRIDECSSAERQKLRRTPNIIYNDDSRYPFNLEVTERRRLTPSFDQMSESDNYEPVFMRPSVSTNRSSFTKDFINCQKRKSWIRNNSIATVERKACYMPKKRRQTFPGPSEGLLQDDFLLPFGESFSSLTMCSHSLQTDKRHQADDRFPLVGKCNPSQGKGDKEDHVFTINRQYRRQSSVRYHCRDPRRPDWDRFVYKDRESLDTDDCGEKEDQAEVADSGFDQDLGEVDYHGSETLIDEFSPRTLAIKIIPPSCCGSEEQMLQSHPVFLQKGKVEDAGQGGPGQGGPGPVQQERSNGEPEQRSLQVDPRPSPGSCSGKTLNVDPDPGGARLKEPKVRSLSAEERGAKPVPGKPTDGTVLLSPTSEDTNPDLSSTDDSHKSVVTTCSDTKVHKQNRADRHSISRSFFEAKELLKPVVHKDLDNGGSDHWAKRRKLFKESKQWSSAGEGSMTSDITEESVSEDAPSIDMTVQDNEDRGFYTETFHSAAWIYQGDDVTSGSIPPSLNSRNRAISIRERTVRISKGTGEYPWGFRIQFSKPIVVTEVDTNGAAEEAGLMVGDYVLAVNGTDVTSIPHSEAADLARQGPDILTLTIGSDIARGPNTPRPACRGYLHKRTHSGLIKGWRKRWFVLTHDCCLYYYRHKRDEGKRQPLSAIRLEGAEVGPDVSLGKPFVMKCRPLSANRVYFLCATTNQEMKRWLGALEKAIHPITQNHVWVDVTRHNSNLPPLAVKNPECLGLLHKVDKLKDMWIQHYCILKDSCLYLYSGIRATHAHGGIYLHGYMVREQPYGSKKSTIELKPPSDEFKTFYFCAENPNENKRWIIALKASIKKWLPLHQALQDYMNQPSEETRM